MCLMGNVTLPGGAGDPTEVPDVPAGREGGQRALPCGAAPSGGRGAVAVLNGEGRGRVLLARPRPSTFPPNGKRRR